MKAYKILLYCFLLLPFPVSADEAEVWKCKIKETMGIKNSGGELRPARFNSQDHEYRILNLKAFIDEVGATQAAEWMAAEFLPLEMGEYFYRSTSMAPDDRFSWSHLRKFIIGTEYHGGNAFFDPNTGRFQTEPAMLGGWFTGDNADYVYEFAECVRFYD
jgi:hypothetical protein